jgi:hypothetical protein
MKFSLALSEIQRLLRLESARKLFRPPCADDETGLALLPLLVASSVSRLSVPKTSELSSELIIL